MEKKNLRIKRVDESTDFACVPLQEIKKEDLGDLREEIFGMIQGLKS